ncbi:hypothetical protein [Streptomyces sp. ODS05-4]|uniref:hypothetical protein n=1 Tax=Streptomyces sp. ODS05-4 TaxID=2944939 RepID=UPI00210C921B|nr:hypothetical protein [Streptomyces sp. ODS05-4]
MADERNAWLDHDAAEKLLRGEPAHPAGSRAADADPARRLSQALAAVRAAHAPQPPPGRELPGEAAALAAFRAAAGERDARAAAATGDATAAAGEAREEARDELGPVRLGPRPARPAPSRRAGNWARGLRWGLAASVAGLAVGGVAVAAGTGVLPVLGKAHEPLPSASVSAAPPSSEPPTPVAPTGSGGTDPSPRPSDGGAPGPGSPSPDDSAPGPRAGDPEADPRRPGASAATPGGPEDGTAPERSESPGEDTAGPGERDRGQPDAGAGATWLERTVRACRDYRSGKLDPDRTALLESDARGRANIERFCDRLLDSPAGGEDDGDGEDARPGGGAWHDGGGRDGAPGRGRGGSGARPSVTLRPLDPALTSGVTRLTAGV